MILVQHLHKSFGKMSALDKLSVEFSAGQSVALIGHNGSGKTTFLKCLLGLVLPTSGSIAFDGKSIAGQFAYRSRIGYMPQIGRYPDHLQVGQLFEMMEDLRISDLEASAPDEELIETFALREIWHKPMRTLSGGMRQKVSAALAFLFDAPVYILDEPTAGLDPLAAEVLKAKIRREQKRGKLFIITSHILADLDELATDVMYLQDGKMLFFKPLQQLKQDAGEEKLSAALAKWLNGSMVKWLPATKPSNHVAI